MVAVFVVGRVAGITCLDNRVYLVYYGHDIIAHQFVRNSPNKIRVYSAVTFRKESDITVCRLDDPTDIVACRDDHRLYVIDRRGEIWQVSVVNTNDRKRWNTGSVIRSVILSVKLDDLIPSLRHSRQLASRWPRQGFFTLSLTSRCLLVTSPWPPCLRQYSTTNRELLREVWLPDYVERLHHAVETSRGTFVVCHERPSSGSELVSFLHLSLLFYGRGYRTVSAILLLDGVMIIISYRSPTITISLSVSVWSQFAMQASTCCDPGIRNYLL